MVGLNSAEERRLLRRSRFRKRRDKVAAMRAEVEPAPATLYPFAALDVTEICHRLCMTKAVFSSLMAGPVPPSKTKRRV